MRRIVLAVALTAAAVTTTATTSSAAPALARPPKVCYYVPDLDGHVWGPCCLP